MKSLLALLLFVGPSWAAAQAPAVQHPQLRKTLDSLAYVDQWPMQRLLAQQPDTAGRNLEDVQRDNSARHQPVLEGIVARYGFPGFQQVGKEGAFEFWFLVQHADAYPSFQRAVLRLMRAEVTRHNASAQDYAFLTDRVALNAGQLQEYGTQVTYTGPGIGRAAPRSLRDPQRVNQRRAAMGMEPLEAYLTRMDQGRAPTRAPQPQK